MGIKQKCWARLMAIGLPMDVVLVDSNGGKITDVRIETDGQAINLANNKRYPQPSALRSDLSEPNGPTYSRLIYKGRTLRDWGVRP